VPFGAGKGRALERGGELLADLSQAGLSNCLCRFCPLNITRVSFRCQLLGAGNELGFGLRARGVGGSKFRERSADCLRVRVFVPAMLLEGLSG
jgi:hypothetical protein